MNLLYPFVPLANFSEAAAKVQAALASIEPFEVSFDDARYFQHGSGATVWLNPSVLHPLSSFLTLFRFPLMSVDEAFL